MKSLFKPSNLIPILLIGVMIISAPIFAAIRAAAVGVNIAELWGWYLPLEIVSGAALVLMEGGALYVISSYWRQFKPFTVYWNILGGIMAVIAFAIPFIVTALFISSQFNMKIYQVLTWNHILINHLTWLWSFSVACIPTILVIGLGIAHGIENELQPNTEQSNVNTEQLKPNAEELRIKAWGLLSDSYAKDKDNWIYPPNLVRLMEGEITEHQAVEFISGWYKVMLSGRPGVKSANERKFANELLQQPISLNGSNQE